MAVLAVLACGQGLPRDDATVDLPRLLNDMIDPLHLTRFPDPFYRGRLASSTDRSATTPQETEGWFKNVDLGNYQGREERAGRTEHILLDAEGPGVVTRIWSANPSGTLRIYIDGSETPALEADMKKLLSGQVTPFAAPFAYVSARGHNLYFPFPFAASCKITMDKDGAFYQVNYRQYEAGTPVTSYSTLDLRRHEAAIAETANSLAARRTREPPMKGREVLRFVDSAEVTGSRIIRELRIRPGSTDPHDLRATTLVLEADGIETARVPLGDFFGTGPGVQAFESLMSRVSASGELTATWPMPFRESFRLRVEGAGANSVEGDLVHAPFSWDERSLYFHAAWQQAIDLPSWPPRDWTLLAIEGQGNYVGTLFQITNASKGWWGEGDEKIWVDDDDFPSHFGTGTEDYFGYAWSTPLRFARPFHGQTRADGPGGYGHFSMYRWHIADPIPFRTRFRFDQELWHWMRKTRVSLSAVAFFYSARGLAYQEGFSPGVAASVPPLTPLPKKQLENVVEGERMAPSASGGQTEVESMIRYLVSLWSADEQMRWRNPTPGDRLVLRFDAPVAGDYRILGHFTRAQDYGTHQLRLNGAPLGDPRDFWSHVVSAQEDVDLGVHRLRARDNELSVESTGSNPRSTGSGHDFGIDALQLLPVAP